MSLHRNLALAIVTLTLAGCGGGQQDAAAQPSPTDLLLDKRGVIQPLDKAVRAIGFRPIVPAADLIATAVIPPLGNEDTQKTRGIAFEYDANGTTMLLSEWPGQSFRIQFGANDASETPCTPVVYSSNGIVFTTPSGLVMTLQPDGDASRKLVLAEARALIARGACR